MPSSEVAAALAAALGDLSAEDPGKALHRILRVDMAIWQGGKWVEGTGLLVGSVRWFNCSSLKGYKVVFKPTASHSPEGAMNLLVNNCWQAEPKTWGPTTWETEVLDFGREGLRTDVDIYEPAEGHWVFWRFTAPPHGFSLDRFAHMLGRRQLQPKETPLDGNCQFMASLMSKAFSENPNISVKDATAFAEREHPALRLAVAQCIKNSPHLTRVLTDQMDSIKAALKISGQTVKSSKDFLKRIALPAQGEEQGIFPR